MADSKEQERREEERREAERKKKEEEKKKEERKKEEESDQWKDDLRFQAEIHRLRLVQPISLAQGRAKPRTNKISNRSGTWGVWQGIARSFIIKYIFSSSWLSLVKDTLSFPKHVVIFVPLLYSSCFLLRSWGDEVQCPEFACP
jgi:hypothetical protein